MTERMCYHDSFLYEFQARVEERVESEDRPAIVLDKTAFYPTSGGQLFDTGTLADARILQVEEENGRVLHFVEPSGSALKAGDTVHGTIDAERRRDHMQQHSGQHVLYAAI